MSRSDSHVPHKRPTELVSVHPSTPAAATMRAFASLKMASDASSPGRSRVTSPSTRNRVTLPSPRVQAVAQVVNATVHGCHAPGVGDLLPTPGGRGGTLPGWPRASLPWTRPVQKAHRSRPATAPAPAASGRQDRAWRRGTGRHFRLSRRTQQPPAGTGPARSVAAVRVVGPGVPVAPCGSPPATSGRGGVAHRIGIPRGGNRWGRRQGAGVGARLQPSSPRGGGTAGASSPQGSSHHPRVTAARVPVGSHLHEHGVRTLPTGGQGGRGRSPGACADRC